MFGDFDIWQPVFKVLNFSAYSLADQQTQNLNKKIGKNEKMRQLQEKTRKKNDTGLVILY